MLVRIAFSFIITVLAAILGVCSFIGLRSPRPIGRSVSRLTTALIPPLLGNLIIIGSGVREVSLVGTYIYHIGMDWIVYALVRFAFAYCEVNWMKPKTIKVTGFIMHILIVGDTISLLLNPFFGHAFTVEEVIAYGLPYYRNVPFLGLGIHRVICYGLFAVVIVFFGVVSSRAPKVFSERYTVILLSVVLAAIWQTFYTFSSAPINRSMIGFGVTGILISYFSLYYRPLRLLDRLLSNIASDMDEALFAFDPTGRCIWVNNPGLELVELEEKDLDFAMEQIMKKFGEIGRGSDTWSVQRVIGSGDSAEYYSLERRQVVDDKDRIAGSYISIRDNTEEQRAIARELYNANHDSLTGLYTRGYLYERIRRRLEEQPGRYYVVFVDVKNFKLVNDVFSTAFGDLALCRLADKIRELSPATCIYGRLAGDTFGSFLPVEDLHPNMLEEELKNLVIKDGSVEYHLLVHLGVYEVAETDKDVSVMFDRAHLALSTITEEYKTHIAFYDNRIKEKVLWGQELTASLQEALEQRQIRPYLQPIADISGRVVGAEALARWIHPVHGFLPPAAFIPVFEKNGMIVETDRYMWRCACELLAKWAKEGRDMFISVNISPKDFFFIDVVAELKGLVEEFGIELSRLRVEITETVMMSDQDERMKTLNELREAGFIVEMDDFGSGYSSLNLLKDMPVDILKIDMNFLSRSSNADRARTIIRNIIKLSEDLGIESLTEGVETGDQYQLLKSMGCRLFQGYHFSKPLPVEEFEMLDPEKPLG